MLNTRDLVLAALFAAIIVALGLVPKIELGFFPVPITAQSLGVMLAGVILGGKRAAIAVLIVLLLVLIGLPVLAGGRGGLAVFAGPTAGFLLGWLPAAYLTGLASESLVDPATSDMKQLMSFFLASVLGCILVLYGCGIVYLSIAAKMGFVAAFKSSMIFIPVDVVKAFIAALAGRAVLAGYPLLPRSKA